MHKFEWHLPWVIGFITGLASYLLLFHSPLSDRTNIAICAGLCITAIHLQLASPSNKVGQWLVPPVIIGLAYVYLGLTADPKPPVNPLIPLLLPLTVLISTSFHQVYCRQQKVNFPYELLFFHAWNTPIILLITSAFTLVAWGLIEAWSLLFSSIGISHFHAFFHHRAVMLTLLAALFGLGIGVLKQYQHIINTLRTLCLSLFKIIYIPIIFTSLLFFIRLPFGELAMNDNWPIIFLVNGLTLLLFNAVYQDGEAPSFVNPLLRYANAALLLLLPLTVIVGLYNCLISLFTQDKHLLFKLTIDGLIYGGLLLLYSISYALALFKKPYWHYDLLRQLNPKLAVVLGVTLYLMATPLMASLRFLG